MKTVTHIRNDDIEYKDFDIFIDDVEGKDWMGSFFFDKASGEYTALSMQVAERPDGAFNEAKDYPASVKQAMDKERQRIIDMKGNI